MSQDPRAQLLDHLRLLTAGARGGQFLDVRWGRAQLPMRKRLIPVGEIDHAARLIFAHSRHCDVYLGPCLRDHPGFGGARAISRAYVLFIDCDRPDAQEALARFAFQPTLEVASGSPGRLHAYWRLATPATPTEIEEANLRLALHLGGDVSCIDVARMLRPAGSLNHKHRPPSHVQLRALHPGARYELSELLHALPQAPSGYARTRPVRAFTRTGGELEQALRAVPARVYVSALIDREPDGHGKLLCPFHEEQKPSLQLYPDGTFFCFGCRAGGSVIDFAARLWGLAPRGAGFGEILDRLGARLLAPSCAVHRGDGAPRAPGAEPACPQFSRP